MRNSERTFLSSIGFHDDDRKIGLHDLICQYLAQESIGREMLGTVSENLELWRIPEGKLAKEDGNELIVPILSKWHPEKKMVFDVFYSRTVLVAPNPIFNRRTDIFAKKYDSLIVEVKTHIKSIPELMAQLNLYYDYCCFDSHVAGGVCLAVPFKVSAELARHLENSNIIYYEVDESKLFEFERNLRLK